MSMDDFYFLTIYIAVIKTVYGVLGDTVTIDDLFNIPML